MVTRQSTIARTVVAKNGMVLPATITPQTDLNLMVTAIVAYHRFNGRKVAYDTLEKAMEAMRDASAIVALYADAKGELASRCLWVTSIALTQGNDITCRAYCTLRREVRSFRLDRILTCHLLTTPDDIQEVA